MTRSNSLEDYDFIRFTWSDVHGNHRGKILPAEKARQFWDTGIMGSSGLLVLSPKSDFYKPRHRDYNFNNDLALVQKETLSHLAWAGKCNTLSKSQIHYKVGNVLCEFVLQPLNQPHPLCTRGIARKLLDQLQSEFQCKFMSGTEHEFIVRKQGYEKREDAVDLHSQGHLCSYEYQNVLLPLTDYLRSSGVNVESVLCKMGHGQMEIATGAEFGIKSADGSFMLREAAKEMCLENGYSATFMPIPYPGCLRSIAHFNHSLWSDSATNAFYEASKNHGMSDIFQHRVAGNLLHLEAMMAFCCPTVNCYRVDADKLVSGRKNWGYDNRYAALRVKCFSPSETYVEIRQVTSAANPYLVMAASLAAGMDGLRRKLQLPDEMDAMASDLPRTLGESLDALEADDVMIDALGEDFIKTFVGCKREMEIEKLSGFKPNDQDPDQLEKERDMYFKYI